MLKTAPCVVLASLKASTYSEYASAFRLLRPCRGTVLSILQAIEINRQLRSRIVQILNVPQRVRLASSLAAALLGTMRVLARQGRAGKKSGRFEQLPRKATPRAFVAA